jgi:predicted ArsR family transcriptional regulator
MVPSMAAGPEDVDETQIAKALSHPIRVRALTILNDHVASSADIARELGLPVANVAYHVNTLARLGCIEEVETRQVRGALEHRYRALRRAAVHLSEASTPEADAATELDLVLDAAGADAIAEILADALARVRAEQEAATRRRGEDADARGEVRLRVTIRGAPIGTPPR